MFLQDCNKPAVLNNPTVCAVLSIDIVIWDIDNIDMRVDLGFIIKSQR